MTTVQEPFMLYLLKAAIVAAVVAVCIFAIYYVPASIIRSRRRK